MFKHLSKLYACAMKGAANYCLAGFTIHTKETRNPRQSLTVNIHCEFSSRFHSDSKRIRSGFESKRRESPRIHNVFAQQYGFANFGRVFTVIRFETLSWEGLT